MSVSIIIYHQAKKTNEGWKESDKCDTIELKSHDHTAHELRNLQANTHYKIELRAHNGIGYSTPGQIIVKTARGKCLSFQFNLLDKLNQLSWD